MVQVSGSFFILILLVISSAQGGISYAGVSIAPSEDSSKDPKLKELQNAVSDAYKEAYTKIKEAPSDPKVSLAAAAIVEKAEKALVDYSNQQNPSKTSKTGKNGSASKPEPQGPKGELKNAPKGSPKSKSPPPVEVDEPGLDASEIPAEIVFPGPGASKTPRVNKSPVPPLNPH